MPICDKCGSRIPEGANFCPQCADAVTEADYTSSSTVAAAPEAIEMIFGYSSSSNYAAAVKLVEGLPNYTCEGDGRDAVHRVTLNTKDVGLAVNLWELVGNWKSSQMFIGGRRVTKKDLTHGPLGCYQRRQEAYNSQQYCYGEHLSEVNIWGCKRLALPLSAWAEWLTWGTFDSAGRWVFDKDRIGHELEKGIHEHSVCPAFDPDRVRRTLEAIPDRIDPKTDPRWEYQRRWQEGKGQVAVGVYPVLNRAAEYVLEPEFRPDWSDAERESASPGEAIEVHLRVPPKPAKSTSRSGCMVVMLVTLSLLCAGALAALPLLRW